MKNGKKCKTATNNNLNNWKYKQSFESAKKIKPQPVSPCNNLKVKNETNNIYQIDIYFDEEYMYGKILSNKESDVAYVISNENLRYVRQNNKIYEIVDIVRAEIDKKTNMQIKKEKLYSEKVEITYELSKDIKIEER